MAPWLNSTAAEWHRSWMVPRLNGTALPYGTFGYGRFVLRNVTFCRSASGSRPYCLHVQGQAVPTDTHLTLPDHEDKGVTVFRNVCVHTYLHKYTTSHPRRQASLATLQWQYNISDPNTKSPDYPLCPSFCIFLYSNRRTDDRMSLNWWQNVTKLMTECQ